MGNEAGEVKEILAGLERQLLDDSVRCDTHRISLILDERFKEFTTSGKVYNYAIGDVFGKSKDEIRILDGSIEMIDLTDDVKLLLYKAVKTRSINEIITNRSSIWKRSDTGWKIVFHQGTLSSE